MEPLELLQKATEHRKVYKKPKVEIEYSKDKSIETTVVLPSDNRNEKYTAKKLQTEEWATMKPSTMDEKAKIEVHLIRNRHTLDPKRHYKRMDKPSKVFALGTIIATPGDSKNNLTRRERKATFADELLADQKTREYLKRRTLEVEAKRNFVTRNGYKIKKRK